MVATGVPGLIHGDMLKPGCAVIDVGINRVKNPDTGKTRLVGDCHFESKDQITTLTILISCMAIIVQCFYGLGEIVIPTLCV